MVLGCDLGFYGGRGGLWVYGSRGLWVYGSGHCGERERERERERDE